MQPPAQILISITSTSVFPKEDLAASKPKDKSVDFC